MKTRTQVDVRWHGDGELPAVTPGGVAETFRGD